MKANICIDGDVGVLEIFGNLTTPTRIDLKKIANTMIEVGVKNLVLELSRCEYIDSSVLVVLCALRKRLIPNGAVVLLDLSPDVRTLFELTNLDHSFRICNSK